MFCREACLSGYVCGNIMTEIISIYRIMVALVDWHTGRVWNGQVKITSDAQMI